MKFIKKIYLSNFTFLILPLLMITITVYVVGLDIFQNQMHERNSLYMEHLKRLADVVYHPDNFLDWKRALNDLSPADGVALMIDGENNLVYGTGSDYRDGLYSEFIKTVDWHHASLGKQYIINLENYYIYHDEIDNTAYTLVYLRRRDISDEPMVKFRTILTVAFFSLVFLFFYLQRNLIGKMVAPLEELIRTVQSLNGRKSAFSLRSVEEDEINLLKTYLTQLQDLVRDRDLKLRRNLFSVMDVLIDLLEIKDSYTASHSKQVRKYSIAIAQTMALPENEVRDIAFAATLHDIGKIGVSHSILNKPGKLTAQEFAIIKQHPVVADEVLRNIEELDFIRNIIRHHHERFDGGGYPDGVAGAEIPLAARIVCVADAFDAMTSDRPYRTAMSFNDAIKILVDEKGKQFDPVVVDALVKYLHRQQLFEVEPQVIA